MCTEGFLRPIGIRRASLRAALQPAGQTTFISCNTQGGHFFGATLAEHNKNVVNTVGCCRSAGDHRRAKTVAQS